MANLCKSDLRKVISYLNDAAKLYDALPMQSMKCRAHMIIQLTNKLRAIELTASANPRKLLSMRP